MVSRFGLASYSSSRKRKMTLANTLKKGIISLGKNTKPAYPMMAVAFTNGIFKPITSLTDKKEKPETKKYAALREFSTEVVAVPTYLLSNLVAEKGAEMLYKNNPEKLVRAKANIGFIGVCAAAVFIIPALCSVVVKPFTDMIFKKNKKENKQVLDVTSKAPEVETVQTVPLNNTGAVHHINRPQMNTFVNNGGLKV